MANTFAGRTVIQAAPVAPAKPAAELPTDIAAMLTQMRQQQDLLEQQQAKIEVLQAKVAAKRTIGFKVGEKGALSLYGLGRFPVTLYAGQWETLIAHVPAIQQALRDNAGSLIRKE